MWASLVKNAVTASEPAAPSEPVSPPTTLNILVVSERLFALFDTDTVNGKSDLFRDEKGTVNVCCPVPPLIVPLKDGVLNVLLPALVIVISPVSIVWAKFCWATVNIIEDGVAVVSTELSNPNTCEFGVIVNSLADVPFTPFEPFVPSVPAFDLVNVWVLLKLKAVPFCVLPLIG